MKKLFFVLVILVIVTSLSFSQETTPKNKVGNWGWLFNLNGLSYLGTGNYNGGVGAKYYLQDDLALRGGVSFSTTSYPSENNNPLAVGVNAGVTYNYAVNGPVLGYIGLQASFGSQKYRGDTSATTSFGVAGLAGFEWFPWNTISIGGEYQLGFQSVKPPSGDATNYFSLGSANAYNLILTVYLK